MAVCQVLQRLTKLPASSIIFAAMDVAPTGPVNGGGPANVEASIAANVITIVLASLTIYWEIPYKLRIVVPPVRRIVLNAGTVFVIRGFGVCLYGAPWA